MTHVPDESDESDDDQDHDCDDGVALSRSEFREPDITNLIAEVKTHRSGQPPQRPGFVELRCEET